MSKSLPHEVIVNLLDNAKQVFSSEREELQDSDSSEAGKLRARPLGYDLEAMNAQYALILVGSRAMVLSEQSGASLNDRVRFLSVDAFKTYFLNSPTEYVKANEILTTTRAERWLRDPKRREFPGIQFRPGETGSKNGYCNLWRGFSVEAKKGGSYSVFRDHLRNIVCQADEALFQWVFAWFAHMFQKPQERIGTALVLRGAMGSGKTKVGEVMGSLVQDHYVIVDDARYVTGQFNSHMASCLFLQADEAVWAGDKSAEGRLKGLVTSKYQMIEQKGIDPIRLENYIRLIMTSNEDWVVPAGKDERRFCVLDVSNTVAQNHEYFALMERELDNGGREALLFDLLHVDLSGINLREIPKTAALLEQKIRSLHPVEAWWFARLSEGAPTRQFDNWPAMISKQDLFTDFIEASDRAGVRRRGYETEIGMKLKKIAPGLTERRAEPDANGRRLRCYLLPALAKAREDFAEAMKQDIDWPAETEEPAANPETEET